LLPPHPQRSATRDEHHQIRTGFYQIRHLWRHIQYVLEVVQNKEDPLVSQVGVQSLAWREMTFGLPQIQRPRNRRENARGVIERRQGDERYAAWEHICAVPRRSDGEARLTDAAYPRER
jgi:hypothetical protein